MKRREFLALLGAAAVAIDRSAAAQSTSRKIAVLGPAEEPRFTQVVDGLRRGLRDLGHPQSVLTPVEHRVTRGDAAAAAAAAQESASSGAAVLFVIGSELARTARQASTELPIVFITPGDPVASGLVASLPVPGRNMTAMTFEFPQLSAKRLELLRRLVPDAQRVVVAFDARDASPRQGLAAARDAAPQLGLTLVECEIRSSGDIPRNAAEFGGATALLSIPGGATSAHYQEIIRAAHASGVATFFHSRSASTVDALASYGASDANAAREAARLVDKILRGENAGHIPVERPTRFELVINLRTARALGVAVPPTLLALADEVIE